MARKAAKAPGGGRKKPAAAVSRKRRPPTPVEVANEVVIRTRLRRVRFSEFSAHTSVPPESMQDDARLQASTNFSRPTVDAGEDAGFRTTSVLVFRLRMPASSSDRSDESEPCVVLKATLEASYAFRDDSPDFTEEQLATFALHYCPFHVWGYWREFVHSSLARLEFPAITVPLFQIDMAQDFIADAR